MNWNEIIGHDRPKKILGEALSRSRLPHAYLFYGPDAIGKKATALALARAVQCEGTNPAEACGRCRSCLSVTAGSHPDVSVIAPDGALIKIDQVRAIQETLVYKPLAGTRKVLVLADADAMNADAANCFLKTLEEPPDHSLLILTTSRPHRLPSTILSRCQQIRFETPPGDRLALHLVERRGMTEGEARLLAALTLGRTGEALSADLSELVAERNAAVSLIEPKALTDLNLLFENAQSQSGDLDLWLRTLHWIQIWIRDALVLRSGAGRDRLINRDRGRELSDFSSRYAGLPLIRSFSLVESYRRSLHRNLNRTLALQTLLLDLRRPLIGAGA